MGGTRTLEVQIPKNNIFSDFNILDQLEVSLPHLTENTSSDDPHDHHVNASLSLIFFHKPSMFLVLFFLVSKFDPVIVPNSMNDVKVAKTIKQS